MSAEQPSEVVDVVVVGGGAAGLSAALNLGRVRRSVTVVDAGTPRNAPSAHMHGYLTRDGMAPTEFLEQARQEVARYGVEVVEARARAARKDDDGTFTVRLEDGRAIRARRLLVATGLVDELPDVAGLRERWGRDVLHCPYCHGWEVRDQAIVVISSGPMGAHSAQLFRQLSDDVTLVVHTGTAPDEAERARLASRGVTVVDGLAQELVVVDDRIGGVRMQDGRLLTAQAVVVTPRMVAGAELLTALGLDAVEHPMGVGRHVPAQPTGATSVPGVWVAGNVTDLGANVALSTAAGITAAAHLNADLIAEEFDQAVATSTATGGHGSVRSTATDQHDLDGHGGHDEHGGHGGHGGDIQEHDRRADSAPQPADDQVFDQAFWDAHYGRAAQVWSGQPNPQLVTEAADLPVGRALDVGAGEGGDAVWLAERGWSVTAVEISPVAVERGRRAAEGRGPTVAERIDWVTADATAWEPPEGSFDLVSLQYLHLRVADRSVVYPRCAEAVAPGGILLIVGHHPSDMETSVDRWRLVDMFFTADELAGELGDEWEVLTTEARPRPAHDHDGVAVTVRDAVLVARRR
jgi:thioredoxin reductase/SAM-dependent methyltransferase